MDNQFECSHPALPDLRTPHCRRLFIGSLSPENWLGSIFISAGLFFFIYIKKRHKREDTTMPRSCVQVARD